MIVRHRFKLHTKTVFLIFLTLLIVCMFVVFFQYDLHIFRQYEHSSVLKKNKFKETESEIRFQLQSYNLSYAGVEDLDDLILERGGQPLRTMLVSSWRSGSTFLGDLFNAMPGNFYHYEPLYNYSIVQIKGPPLADNALRTIRSLFNCSYRNMEHYFKIYRQRMYLFRHNSRLRKQCEENEELCFDVDFVERICKLFPFQSMKLVRLRLRLVREIMQDYSNVRTIYMVRDPRAVIQSRRRPRTDHEFCYYVPECSLPEYLCADMISDYNAAGHLLREYPNRVMVLRFEELALNPRTVAEKLLTFSGRQMLPAIKEFLYTHTHSDPKKGDTYRETQSIPFKWKDVMEFEDVNEIQVMCKQAMDLWGYELVHNKTHMKSKQFNPLKEYTIIEL